MRSMLSFGYGVPGSIIDLAGVADWCPRCFMEGRPVPAVAQLETYFKLLSVAYDATPAEVAAARRLSETEQRVVAGSPYLGAIVPESAATYNVLGLALAQQGQLDGALQAFRRALELDPDDAAAHWHVGSALASGGAYPEATSHLARSVELDPANSRAHSDLGLLLAFQGRLDEGVDHLERAIALDPQADDLRKNLEAVLQQRQRAAGQP